MAGSIPKPRTLFLGAIALAALGLTVLALWPPGQAGAAGLNLNNTASAWRFIIPGGPGTKIVVKIPPGATAPMLVTVADNISFLFPTSGEILVSGTELMVYDNNSGAGACAGRTAFQFCVTARAKVGQVQQHDPPATGTSTDPFAPGGRVKLATQLQATLGAPVQSIMTGPTEITAAQAPPFKITLASAGDAATFGASGELTITHENTDVRGPTPELMRYTNGAPCSGTLATQLCITVRNMNPNNFPSNHKASGYAQACSASVNAGLTCPHGGVTLVTKHVDVLVKAGGTAGFFPASPLIIYDLSSGGIISNTELVNQVTGAGAVKLSPAIPANNFRITNRRDVTATYDQTGTAASTHAPGSVVTWPDSYVTCRNRYEQPGAFAGAGASSVGAFLVCYTRTEPGVPPKTLSPKKLLVPIVGQPLIILNSISQPFLSTGGFCHVLYGAVGPGGSCPGTPPASIDPNGTADGTLLLTSPCIIEFTPGVNLKWDVTLTVDKSFAIADIGSIRVVVDTIHDTPNSPTSGNLADNCDDPAGTSEIRQDTYYTGSGAAPDTDADGCTDNEELSRNSKRDPWNPWDFFNPDWNPLTGTGTDTTISVADINNVAGRFGALGDPNSAWNPNAPAGTYNRAFDRGPTYGPFAHNTSPPNGVIDLGDVMAISAQWGTCAAGQKGTPITDTPTPTPTVTSTPTVTPTPTSTVIPKQGKIFPVAGGSVGDLLPGASAALSGPSDVEAVDLGGGQVELYIADTGHCRVRKISSTGTISTVAGTGICAFGGDGGPATGAQLNAPAGVTFDGSNLYIADTGNCRVRKVTAGTITAVAGTGTCGLSGDGGSATSAQLNAPTDILVSGSDRYIADTGNCRVRKVTAGTITTVAGSTCGLSGDGGSATSAQLNAPTRLALNGGDLYIADTGNCRVRKVTGGVISTVAGTTCGFSGDTGPATSAQLNAPSGIILGSGGLSIADTGNCRVRNVTAGTITTIAGTGTCGYNGESANALFAQLNHPAGLDADAADRLFLADRDNHRVRRIGSPIATVAGTGLPDFCGDTYVAISDSCLDSPNDVVVDPAGNVFIADTGNRRVRWVDVTSGAIYTIAGKTDLSSCPTTDGGAATNLCLPEPMHLALDPVNEVLFVSDRVRNQVWALNLLGLAPLTPPSATRVAGSSTGASGSCVDGASSRGACLNAPRGLAFQRVGSDRYLFIAQEGNNGAVVRVDLDALTIRKVFENGLLSSDIELGRDGLLDHRSLYVAQPDDHRIRRVYHGGNGLVEGVAYDADEIVTVVAGTGSAGQPTEGGTAASQPLYWPGGVGMNNAHGALLISDRDNHTLWVVTEPGVPTPIVIDGGANERIFRIAGDGSFTPGFCGDPTTKANPATPPNAHPSREACLNSPAGLFYHDADSATFFADRGNDRVRKIPSDCDADGLTDKYEAGFYANYMPPPGFPFPTNSAPLNPCKSDSDGDGCSDARELGINAPFGGRRDPTNPWDLFDVDGDRAVTIDDVAAVASRFLVNVGEPTYLAAADRGATLGPNLWNTAGPDGSIVIDDVASVAAQFLHGC